MSAPKPAMRRASSMSAQKSAGAILSSRTVTTIANSQVAFVPLATPVAVWRLSVIALSPHPSIPTTSVGDVLEGLEPVADKNWVTPSWPRYSPMPGSPTGVVLPDDVRGRTRRAPAGARRSSPARP